MENLKYQKNVKDVDMSGDDKEKFVTFVIGDEKFGVDILKVRDIIDMTEITQVPQSPLFIKGVINLRGTIVPVVDMRLRFRLTEKKYDSYTVIIVVEVNDKLAGMIVDSVSDVVDITVTMIENSPHFKSNINGDYIRSIGMLNDQLFIILDVDKILIRDDEKAASGKMDPVKKNK